MGERYEKPLAGDTYWDLETIPCPDPYAPTPKPAAPSRGEHHRCDQCANILWEDRHHRRGLASRARCTTRPGPSDPPAIEHGGARKDGRERRGVRVQRCRGIHAAMDRWEDVVPLTDRWKLSGEWRPCVRDAQRRPTRQTRCTGS